MKKLAITTLSLLAMISGLGNAFAGDLTTELKVTGTLTPGSCTIALAGMGNIAYDTTKLNALLSSGLLNINSESLIDAITVNCDGATIIGVNVVDNRAATVIPESEKGGSQITFMLNSGGPGTVAKADQWLGLGLNADGEKIGAYAGSFNLVTADGKAVQFSTCKDEATLTGGEVVNGGSMTVVTCPAGQSYQVIDSNGTSVSAKTFVWSYVVDAAISNKLDLSKPFSLDGSVTVQINYL